MPKNNDSMTKISYSSFEEFRDLLNEEFKIIEERSGNKSHKTDIDYLKLSKALIKRAQLQNIHIENVIRNTKSPRTFYKRISAISWYVIRKTAEFSDTQKPIQSNTISELIDCLKAIKRCRETGLIGNRDKRKSKRLSIRNLDSNWREELCNRGNRSHYYQALLITSITGCRPSEIANGVKLWISFNSEMNENCIHIQIKGTKVKQNQGQESRTLIFKTSHKNSILQNLIYVVSNKENSCDLVRIQSANNFTQEIRRMCKLLWPKHKHPITAYSLRHQAASDFKKFLSSGDVSRALGHASSKTKKTYGSASQSKSGLAPDIVLSTREVKMALVKKIGKDDSFEP